MSGIYMDIFYISEERWHDFSQPYLSRFLPLLILLWFLSS